MSWWRQKQGRQARRILIEPLWQKLTSGGWRRVQTPESGSRDLAQHVLKRQSVRSWGWETGTLLIFTDRIAAMRNGWRTKNVRMEKTKWKSVCLQNSLLKFHPMWLVKQPRGIEMAHAWMNFMICGKSAAALKFNEFYQSQMLYTQVKISVGSFLFKKFSNLIDWPLRFVKWGL